MKLQSFILLAFAITTLIYTGCADDSSSDSSKGFSSSSFDFYDDSGITKFLNLAVGLFYY